MEGGKEKVWGGGERCIMSKSIEKHLCCIYIFLYYTYTITFWMRTYKVHR